MELGWGVASTSSSSQGGEPKAKKLDRPPAQRTKGLDDEARTVTRQPGDSDEDGDDAAS